MKGRDRRLSLARCREHLGASTRLSDSELQQLRDHLYDLAQLIIGAYTSTKPSESLSLIPEGDRLEVEERAAILEFEGGLARTLAERLAVNAYQASKLTH